MKKLRYVRHAPQKREIIGQRGLDLTQEKVRKADYTDVFYGPIYRTVQTILAAVASLGCRVRVHEPIEEVGTYGLFRKMFTSEVEEAGKSGLSNLQALDKVHTPHQIKKWEKMAAQGVQKMFSLISENGYGLCYGHDPIISLAARAFGAKDVKSLDALKYIYFLQNDSGEIAFFFIK